MPRRPDDARRHEIAMAALQVLRQRGILATSMSDLATALEIKRPTLYFYFPDVTSILEHVQRSVREDAAAFVGARLVGLSHPLDILEAVVVSEHDFYESQGLSDVLLMMAQFWGSGDDAVRERFRRLVLEQLGPSRALLSAFLAQGIREGTVKPCDPEKVVDFAFSFLHGAMVHALLVDMRPKDLHPLLHDALAAWRA